RLRHRRRRDASPRTRRSDRLVRREVARYLRTCRGDGRTGAATGPRVAGGSLVVVHADTNEVRRARSLSSPDACRCWAPLGKSTTLHRAQPRSVRGVLPGTKKSRATLRLDPGGRGVIELQGREDTASTWSSPTNGG